MLAHVVLVLLGLSKLSSGVGMCSMSGVCSDNVFTSSTLPVD